MISKKQIEIELRSLLDINKYRGLEAYLKDNALDLGEDDKEVYFFLLSDKIFKAVRNISGKSAKIVAKLNRLGRGSSDFEEIEIPIDSKDFEKTVRLFSALPFEQIERSYQKRHNYRYLGVDLALKHSESWGYHMELEIVVEDSTEKASAEKKIREVARKLGLKIMTEKEVTLFAKAVDEKYRKGKYQSQK